MLKPLRNALAGIAHFQIAARAALALAAAPPQIHDVLPRGAQRGREVVVTFVGERLSDPQDVLFHRGGLGLIRFEPVDNVQTRAVLRIDADCLPGPVGVRLRTAAGVSNLRLFSVGVFPDVAEAEPNNDRDSAQSLTPPATVNGVIAPEDVDLFAINGAAGETLAVEIEAMRLGDTVFDPRIALYDETGRELASADDTPLVRQDAAMVVTLPTAGRYFVEARETAFGGSGACRYRLHVGAFPRPFAVHPAGGTAGAMLTANWIGDPTATTQPVTLPADSSGDFPVLPVRDGVVAPSAVPMFISAFPAATETEPNENDDQATAITVPGGAAGIIAARRDVDCYVFEGAKGQVWEARLFARRLRSPLDAVLSVRRHKGGGLAGNDDAAGPDPVVRFTLPEDGKYVIEVRDLLFKGGAEFTYFLEVGSITPALVLSTPPEQEARVTVAAGNRAGMLLTATRRDFGGPLNLAATELPAGVSMATQTVAANVNQTPIVFEAAADAAPAGSLVDLRARHADENVKIEGRLFQTIDLVKILNDVPIVQTSVDRLAVAVGTPLPFRVSLVEPKVPLVQRGILELPIEIERNGDFKGDVTVRMIWNPPGVGSGTLTLKADQPRGLLPLNASEGAAVGKWPIAVTATADWGGPVATSSQLATLEVAPPFLDFAIARTRTETGKPVVVAVKVTQTTPFDGPARVELLGLPPKVATTQASVTRETTSLDFALAVDRQAPVGWHGGLFVRAVVTRDGEPIVHQSPSGLLIIDAPLPPPDPAAEAARAEARKKAEEEKARQKAARMAAAEQRRQEREAKRAAASQPGGGESRK